jgi:hypothetical protein
MRANNDMGETTQMRNNALIVKNLTMLNFQFRKRNLVCKTQTVVFSFTTIIESLLMCTKQVLRPLAQASA